MTLLVALGLVAALAFATWLVSLWRRDVSIVDGMWPVFIASAGFGYAVMAPPPGVAGIAALALLAGWAGHTHVIRVNASAGVGDVSKQILAGLEAFWAKPAAGQQP